MSNLYDRLVERGWRITPQRRVIAQALEGRNLHLTAEEINERASASLPEISLATVYNTLNELASMGEVREVCSGSGPKRYDPNVEDRHQHLICTACGDIWDVQPLREEALGIGATECTGFTVDQVQIVFRGRCAACAPPQTG